MRSASVLAYASIISVAWLHHASPTPTPTSLDAARRASPPPNSGGDLPGPRNLALSAARAEAYWEEQVGAWLLTKRADLERVVFVSYDRWGRAAPSTAYTYDDFLPALRSMSVGGVGGTADRRLFYVGQDGRGIVAGLVNLAAFLAHGMAVAIRGDTCDEVNADATDGTMKFAVSNACGQWGRSYQGECLGDEAALTCAVDPGMTLTAASSRLEDGAPPPLECGPKESAADADFTGHWDAATGELREQFPYANRAGVMHNEGCCWWGRGVLMTRGACNFGKANRYLGRPAAQEGFLNYFDVDLCVYPEIICEGPDTRELRWTLGYFEWADRVQTFRDAAGVDYMAHLDEFVRSGFVDVNAFVDVIGDALPFGCDGARCREVEEQVAQERRDNFVRVLFSVLGLQELHVVTPFPTLPPTSRPTPELTSAPTPRPTPVSTPDPTPRPTPRPTEPLAPAPTERPSPAPVVPTTAPPTEFPTDAPTAAPATSRPSSQLHSICRGQSSGTIPIDECKGYVQCLNGRKVDEQFCTAGLLFDAAISQCNWHSRVTSCTATSMTTTPALAESSTITALQPRGPDLKSKSVPVADPPTKLTQQPIPPPTQQPMPHPSSSFPFSMGSLPVSTPAPLMGPAMEWALQQTPFPAQYAMPLPSPAFLPPLESEQNRQPTRSSTRTEQGLPGQPFESDYNGQAEGRKDPIYPPTSLDEKASLIMLPSGTSLCKEGRLIFSIGLINLVILL